MLHAIWMNIFWYQLHIYHHNLVDMQLNIFPTTHKLLPFSEDNSNSDELVLIPSSGDGSTVRKLVLVLDLVL